MATNKKAAASKELTVVAVYKFKTDGKLNGTRCTLVRNEKGEEHKVWTHTNGCASSCDCTGFVDWHRQCRHIKLAEARNVATQPVTSEQPAVVETAQPVVVAAPKAPAATAIVALKQTPTVRSVSKSWLLGQRSGGAFSGRVA